MNKTMKIKRALNNTRCRNCPHDYFSPMHNLAQDFWEQDYYVQIAAVYRSDFLHSFILAVVEQTAYMNEDEDFYYPRIEEALSDKEYSLYLFDDVMHSYLPCMPDKRRVRALFKRVRAAK